MYPRLLATLLCEVLPKSGPRLLKFPPIFRVLNGAFSAAIGRHSWHEIVALFDRHDVWFCPVNTPGSLLTFPQARASNIFDETPVHGAGAGGAGVRVKSPLRFGGQAQ